MAKKTTAKKDTIRARAQKSASTKPKKRRIRSAAGSAGRPLKRVLRSASTEYHLIPQAESGIFGFFTKSRSLFPRYVINSWKELRKVSWPNRVTTWKLVLAVFLFATVFGVTIALVDYGLEKVFKQILL